MSKDLIAKLQQKQEEDRRQVEALTLKNLQMLGANLTSAVEKELLSTELNIAKRASAISSSIKMIQAEASKATGLTSSLTRMTLKPFLSALITILLILTIICGASWGAMQYLSSEILKRGNELQQLADLKIAVQKNGESTLLVMTQKPDLWQSQQGAWVIEIKEK